MGRSRIAEFQSLAEEAVEVSMWLDVVDERRLFPHSLPYCSATEEEIREAKEATGIRERDSYLDFLRVANGWSAFYQAVDLFGTEELCGGSQMAIAQRYCRILEEAGAFCAVGLEVGDLVPIGVSQRDTDLFLLERPTGAVHWFAGYAIERSESFLGFFAAMIDLNRKQLEELLRYQV